MDESPRAVSEKKMQGVGFEPTPPKRIVPETTALDHSAILASFRKQQSAYKYQKGERKKSGEGEKEGEKEEKKGKSRLAVVPVCVNITVLNCL